MKNPEPNHNLDHLFNKAKADEQSLDDFEKEAMAGFDMLYSEQEAKDLKANLDTRIHNELFKKEEKNNPKIYWLAAAGLALVIGLSTLFVINNNDSINNNNVAVTDEKNKEEVLPDSKKQLSEEVSATPAEPVLKESAVTDNSPAKEVAEAEEKPNQEFFKSEPTQDIKKDETTSRMIMPATNAMQGPKDGIALEQNKAEQTDESVTSNTSNNNNLDDLAKKDKAKESERENNNKLSYTTTAGVKTDQTTKAAEESEKKVSDKLGSADSKKKGKKEKDRRSSDAEEDLKQPVAVNTKNEVTTASTEGKSSTKPAKKTSAKQNNSVASDDVYNNTSPGSGNFKTDTNNSAGEPNPVPAETQNRKENFTNCYYVGGEPAITKDLREKLSAQNLDKKFDVTVYVNEIKVVEKVEFTNAYDLNAKQKEDITKILKTLDKFNFFMSPTTKGTHPYKILYRP